MPSEGWNSELQSIFLPEKSNSPGGQKKSNASNPRILTSSEISEPKKEKEQPQEQKAKAGEERNVRAQGRKLQNEKKRGEKLAKQESKK